MCSYFEDIIVAQALPVAPSGHGTFVIVTLPVWAWLPPKINIGRKARRADGRTMLMPVRMTWSTSHVIVLAQGESVECEWSMAGMGHKSEGTTVLTWSGTRLTLDAMPGGEAEIRSAEVSAIGAEIALQRMTVAADEARWKATMRLQPNVERAVMRAVTVVSADVLGEDYDRTLRKVLDETAREKVRDVMMLGDEGSTGSAVSRLIDRCLAPGAFARVDPLMYLMRDLNRAAESHVRKHIDDPYIGRKIRKVHRSMPDASIEEIVAAYRELHPGDDLSVKRALRAMTSGPDPMSVAHLTDDDDVLDTVYRERS